MRRSLPSALSLVALVSSGCGGGSSTPAPPSFVAPPAALSLEEGGDVTGGFSVSSGAGLTASVLPVEGFDLEMLEFEDEPSIPPRLDSTRRFEVRAHARFGATSATTQVVLTRAGEEVLRAPLTITVTSLRWRPTTTWKAEGPEAREHGALIVDEARRRVILVGGSGYAPYGTPLADAWAFGLADQRWTKLTITGDAPAAGGSRRVAWVDAAHVYLFGGYGEGSAVDADLYRLDLSGETIVSKKLAHTGGAPARSLHAFAYDGPGDRFVVFGGASTKALADTWTMKIAGDTVTWTKLDATGPSARYGFFYGFDAALRRLVIFSGAQRFSPLDPAQDTWALDLGSSPPAWRAIATESPAPPGRRNGCFVYDERRHALFVFGGTADAKVTEPGFFVLDALPGRERWTKLVRDGEPALRSSGIGFYDPTRREITCGFGNTTSAVYADFTAFGP